MSRPTTAVGYAEMFRRLGVRADGFSSVELPDSRVLWFLGDTQYGGTVYRNSFVVQDGTSVDLLLEHIPNDGAAWYWPNGAVIEGSNVRVFATRFTSGPVSTGTYIFTFDASTLALTATSARINTTWTGPDGWGMGVFQGTSNTYIYGATGTGISRNLYVAHVANGSVTNIASWTYLGQTATAVGAQFSVYEEGKALTKLNLATAVERWEAATSTFSGRTRTDIAEFEASSGGWSTYFAMAHPWATLDSGKMLASVSQNYDGFTRHYFPIFLELDNTIDEQSTRTLTARASGGSGYVRGHGIEANQGSDSFDFPAGAGVTVTQEGDDFRGWDGDPSDTEEWHALDLSEDQEVSGAFGSSFAVARELPTDRVNVVVMPTSLAAQRWASDEAITDNVIDSLTFSDEMPGGDKELSGQLARLPNSQWYDIEAYERIVAHGSGGEVLWEGSLQSAPQSSGDTLAINPAAVGDQDLLGDENKAVRALIADADLGRWTGCSREGRLDFLGNGFGVADAGVDTDQTSSLPALTFTLDAAPGTDVETLVCVGMYDAGAGVDVARVYYDATTEASVGTPLPDINARSMPDDSFATITGTSTPSVPSDGYLTLTGDRVFTWFTETDPNSEGQFTVHLRNLRVYGDHGLTGQGADPEGFYAKDIFTYLIETYAPAEITVGEADDDGFIVPQAAWPELTTLAEMIREISRYGLLDWFVRGRKAYLYTRGDDAYSRRWRARIREGQLDEAGMDASRLWRSVVVRFQDVAGVSRTIGPVGAPVDEESANLEITDSDHPAVIADRTRRDILDLQGVSTSAVAEQIGARFLEEANRLSRAGQATVHGYIEDSNGCLCPVSEIRSGDEIAFLDASDPSPRRIVGRSYNHTDRAAQLELDAPPQALEALLERINAKLGALGLGG